MLRQLIKLRPSLVRLNSRFVTRHFSSEFTSDWPAEIKTYLEKARINQPTVIQEKTLPIATNNRDLVGIARTGSGKTLAFVIPAVMKILKNNSSQERGQEKLPSCLILAPTRELAGQTADVLKGFRSFGIKSLVLVGGASRSAQVNELSYSDHDVYIATPGRLLDLMDSQLVDLSNIDYLVFDEADRMLDMGFEPQIRKIVAKLPSDRQTLMWSATWPAEIQSLANEFMNNYEYIAVDSEKLKANPNIQQLVEVCEPRNKLRVLLDNLGRFREENQDPRTLVFVNTKRMADGMLLQLMRNRYRAVSMHGDRSQRQRDEALRLFKQKSCNIMVATDVAARGLDINDISHVINYDFPNTIEDYIHRIGRTARHDKKGVSLALLTPNDANHVEKLIRVLKETNQEIPAALEGLRSYREPRYMQPKFNQNRRIRAGDLFRDYD